MQKIIIDSDWGSDVLQLTSLLVARPREYEVIGATVVFGNAPHNQNLENAGSMLKLLQIDHRTSRFAGNYAPSGQAAPPEGDGAHGEQGLGAVTLDSSQYPPKNGHAVDFILGSLEDSPVNTITLIATGPQTNIAQAIRSAPETMKRLKEIRIMGGCTSALSGYRVDGDLNRLSESRIERFGNITEHAEFNFQQAPKDADTVLKSGIPICLFPMNCTHQMTFTPQREAMLRQAFDGHGTLAEKLVGLLSGPRNIDFQKFGIEPTLHDAHTTISLAGPHLYQGRTGVVSIETDEGSPECGRTRFAPSQTGRHWVAESVTDTDAAYRLLVDSLAKTLIA